MRSWSVWRPRACRRASATASSLAGIAAATVLRILFAGAPMHLLEIIGMTLAGGILLLWVAWKMYREIRAGYMVAGAKRSPPRRPVRAETAASRRAGCRRRRAAPQDERPGDVADRARRRVDVARQCARGGRASRTSPSLDARRRSGAVGRADGGRVELYRAPAGSLFWISWVGLGIITFVALRMIWDGSAQIIGHTTALHIGL